MSVKTIEEGTSSRRLTMMRNFIVGCELVSSNNIILTPHNELRPFSPFSNALKWVLRSRTIRTRYLPLNFFITYLPNITTSWSAFFISPRFLFLFILHHKTDSLNCSLYLTLRSYNTRSLVVRKKRRKKLHAYRYMIPTVVNYILCEVHPHRHKAPIHDV